MKLRIPTRLQLSMAARVRLGFALVVALILGVALLGVHASREGAEQARQSLAKFDLTLAVDRAAREQRTYFDAPTDEAATRAQTALRDLSQAVLELDGVSQQRRTPLWSMASSNLVKFGEVLDLEEKAATAVSATKIVAEDLLAGSNALNTRLQSRLERTRGMIGANHSSSAQLHDLTAQVGSMGRLLAHLTADVARAASSFDATPEAEHAKRIAALNTGLAKLIASSPDELADPITTYDDAVSRLNLSYQTMLDAHAKNDLSGFKNAQGAVISDIGGIAVAAADFQRVIKSLLSERSAMQHQIMRQLAIEEARGRDYAEMALGVERLRGATRHFLLTGEQEAYQNSQNALSALVEPVSKLSADDKDGEHQDIFTQLDALLAAYDERLVQTHTLLQRRASAITEMATATNAMRVEMKTLAEELAAAAVDKSDASATRVLSLGAAAILCGLAASILIANAIAKPVQRITREIRAVADGQLDTPITDAGRRDEIGAMASAVEVFRANALEVRRLAQTEEQVQQAAERQRAAAMQELHGAFGGVVQAAAGGDLTRRIVADFDDAQMRALKDGMNQVLATMDGFVSDVSSAVAALAEGDLTRTVSTNYQGAFGELGDSLNRALRRLSDLLRVVRRANDGLSEESASMAAASGDLAADAQKQSQSLDEANLAMTQMRAAVSSSTTATRETQALVSGIQDRALESGDIVRDAKQAMAKLADGSGKITDIAGVIDNIAFQTNLLSLNATVEAARAGGDAGKGFAVVAAEVRALAQRSAASAHEIKALLTSSAQQVSETVTLVERTNIALNEIVSSIKDAAERVSSVSRATQEQDQTMSGVAANVQALESLTSRTAAAAESGAAGARELSAQVERMSALVAAFQLPDEAEADDAQELEAAVAGGRL